MVRHVPGSLGDRLAGADGGLIHTPDPQSLTGRLLR